MLCAGMKVVFTALLDCLPTVVAVVMLSFLFYITFAILGVGLFMGQFYRCDCGGDWGKPERDCTDPDWESLNMTACEAQGGAWENPPFNFDNIPLARRALPKAAGILLQNMFYILNTCQSICSKPA